MPLPTAEAAAYNVTNTQVCTAGAAANGWHTAGCWVGSGAAVLLALSWIGTHLCSRRRRRRRPAPVLPTSSTATSSSAELPAPAPSYVYAAPSTSYTTYAAPATSYTTYAPPATSYTTYAPPAPIPYAYDGNDIAYAGDAMAAANACPIM